MNTEKMIPIDFCRNITPFVPGDVYYNNFVDAEFTMDQQEADGFNNADPESEFNTYFIVSFADRPNTTGKQPVDSGIMVHINNEPESYNAGSCLIDWSLVNRNKTWKIDHAALLAKFKEQGANTMFTGKKAKEATHIIGKDFKKIIPGNMPEYLNDDGVWVRSNHDVKWLLTHPELTELSRPVGERKEDHTIDGILTKAQPQGAKAQAVALTIEALEDNPDGQVLNEDWLIDHLTEQKESACPGVKSETFDLDDPLPQHWKDRIVNDKPVFTQDKLDYHPWDGKESLDIGMAYTTGGGLDCMFIGIHAGIIIGRPLDMSCHNKLYLSTSDQSFCKPIDSRTDEQRAVDDLIEIMQSDEHSYSEIIGLIKDGKIHGVKWIIE